MLERSKQSHDLDWIPAQTTRGASPPPKKTDTRKGELSNLSRSPLYTQKRANVPSVEGKKFLGIYRADADLWDPNDTRIEQHIAFVERQRNPGEEEALKILGPRDSDRGVKPFTLEAPWHDIGHLDREPRAPSEPSKTESSIDRASATASSGTPLGDIGPVDIEKANGPYIKRATTFDQKLEVDTHRSAASGPRMKRAATTGDLPAKFTYSIVHSGFLQASRGNHQIAKSSTAGNGDLRALPYLSYTPTIGRNSTFTNLTQKQREELGGIEYRALKTLAFILTGYYVGFHILGLVCFLPWNIHSKTYSELLTGQAIGRPWWAFFTSASLFNDLGFTLTPNSMVSFQNAELPLLLGSFLIVIGNTGFPCMLRFIIWLGSKLVPVRSGIYEELRFLLDHPRRCFTLLFPGRATWWLFWTLAIFNGLDLLCFIVLDLNDETVMSLSPGTRILAGWFQATSTRTAGFSVVNIAELRPAIQVSYMIMMYISAFPVAMSVRRTNVFEERSLGIWGRGKHNHDADSPTSYVGAHLRRQLSSDMWYIFLGLFIIAIAEGKHLENTQEDAFTGFSILFEIVSAYGTVVEHISSSDTKTLTEISVQDNRCGISEAALDSLFQDLEQVLDDNDDDNGGGNNQGKSGLHELADKGHTGPIALGLGLAMTARFVRLNASHVSIESELEKGTRASLKMPFRIARTEKTRDQDTRSGDALRTPPILTSDVRSSSVVSNLSAVSPAPTPTSGHGPAPETIERSVSESLLINRPGMSREDSSHLTPELSLLHQSHTQYRRPEGHPQIHLPDDILSHQHNSATRE
ncbi:uncharacterized protein RAG0_03156 [Rhynchosporium agropyri]|uniref:Potassium transport protein n=1 Tax=Rhynchosporium agropyri TaxID=914238 RepID=A0A1E1K346_9HELO|nr:uncharacterized protein RAG0_03156 [Rhynchosporium agropyri]